MTSSGGAWVRARPSTAPRVGWTSPPTSQATGRGGGRSVLILHIGRAAVAKLTATDELESRYRSYVLRPERREAGAQDAEQTIHRPAGEEPREGRVDVRDLAPVGRLLRDAWTGEGPGHGRRASLPELVHGH